jgi:zinc transport system ATP-binding protein
MTDSQQPLIELSNICASYEEKVALTDVNLTIYEKDFLGIIGPNGGGKTTLIKLILGLKKPSSGTIRFFRGGNEVQNLRMGYLPQYSSIDKKFPISVYEVILSGLSSQKQLFRRYTAQQHQMVNDMVHRMGLEGMEQTAIGALSGGQLQRVLLGRALVSEPDVVILDEPNTYIDARFQERLYELLGEVNKERAIVLVSHDIGSVVQNVKTIACVNETLDYHPDAGLSEDWIEEHFGCPIDLIGHGDMPHRILKCHCHDH